MKQLKIVVDCDDVLLPTTNFLVDTYNTLYGTAVLVENAHSSNNQEWQTDRQEVIRRLNEIQRSKEFGLIKPTKDAIDVIKRQSEKHQLYLVTARPDAVDAVTNRMIGTYFAGLFSEVHHIGPGRLKGDLCRLLQANVLIDDNIKHIADANQCGIEKTIWFGDYAWQVSAGSHDLDRCNNWNEVENAIEQFANN